MNITTWATTDALHIYNDGKLVAVVPVRQFPALIEALARMLPR
jgi:hypothetical protein